MIPEIKSGLAQSLMNFLMNPPITQQSLAVLMLEKLLFFYNRWIC